MKTTLRHFFPWLLRGGPVLRLVACGLLLIGLGVPSPLSARITSERLLKAIFTRTPAPRLVAEGQQLEAATRAAADIPGAVAYWGVGRSMEPLYATRTAIVVVPIEYAAVKKGMTLVYQQSCGARVAHSVVGETRGGYLVQGLLNDEPDAGVVNEENLIGVIVSAYATADTPFRIELAQRLGPRNSSRAAKTG
ncbi:MAG: hypothetical protein JNG82_10210 [Opitutaceae bacterium]|nr:hypothetical protein [Opitutaceae bacterium]